MLRNMIGEGWSNTIAEAMAFDLIVDSTGMIVEFRWWWGASAGLEQLGI
ncbi:hypothetical protein [Rubritalea tangerina]